MKQINRLKDWTLLKSEKSKQKNGTYIDRMLQISKYKAISQDIMDQVSASIYGADINKITRISTPFNELEKFLETKNNTSEDNISLYFLEYNRKKYKIISVKKQWIDIELI